MKEIIGQLEKITSRGYSHYSVFGDWLDLMVFAFQRNDDEYLKIVRKYRNDQPVGIREIDYFANAMGLLMKEMAETNDEMLGEIYMQWNISNKYTGQFFTPKHIARMMSQISAPKGGLISDPACGSGIMLVEACKTMTNEELDKSLFIAQDIDLTCVRMCALNMMFFNLNAYIILGNTLKMDDYQRVYMTSRSYLGGSIRELSEEEIEVIKPKITKFSEPKNGKAIEQEEIEQLMLF